MTTLFIVIVLISLLYQVYVVSRRASQLGYINRYRFHPAIRKKLKTQYPQLSDEQVDSVFSGLRDYFYICNRAKHRMVAMPSQVVDDAWHEFILFTRSYDLFCKKGLGRFLHHTPAEAMTSPGSAQDGIKRAWRLSCIKEKINPKTPTHLPTIFALDSKLAIPGGFVYSLNCLPGDSGYCAAQIGCGGGCSSGCGGGGSGCSSDGGCSGGCGGD